MTFTELYFKLKIFTPLVLLGIALVAFVIAFTYGFIMCAIKERLLEKNGFVYEQGLPGRYIAYEFQSMYVKGRVKIRYVDAMNKSYKQLKYWIKRNGVD